MQNVNLIEVPYRFARIAALLCVLSPLSWADGIAGSLSVQCAEGSNQQSYSQTITTDQSTSLQCSISDPTANPIEPIVTAVDNFIYSINGSSVAVTIAATADINNQLGASVPPLSASAAASVTIYFMTPGPLREGLISLDLVACGAGGTLFSATESFSNSQNAMCGQPGVVGTFPFMLGTWFGISLGADASGSAGVVFALNEMNADGSVGSPVDAELVPEPGAWSLVAVGMAAILVRRLSPNRITLREP